MNTETFKSKPISPANLRHGGIYLFKENLLNNQNNQIQARCNISSNNDEYWFTNKIGEEVTGTALQIFEN
ncbi:hypothetical protein A1QO_03875 [Vibrio genomosp. F10 str. ZF-129]|uniref:Uncharacterized protein n=1 Tax=Vibrio genomosp. F10 str. ZF-129 TaxID=1187848 RepID=A0A1E5BIJ8_9VIBR|nr:hypothetical protein [Vibrio genomosp. F10]OEE37251.1 hypothetical protein A1QO_03875 [Vibrio genomosp. F10 str. ZF-129]